MTWLSKQPYESSVQATSGNRLVATLFAQWGTPGNRHVIDKALLLNVCTAEIPCTPLCESTSNVSRKSGDLMSREMLSMMAETLRTRYLNHEIGADEYASLSEDIKLAERRSHG